MISGLVKNLNCDGYERYINIWCDGKEIGSIWVYFVDENYVESSIDKSSINVGDRLDFKLHIDLVCCYKKVRDNCKPYLKQPIDESSHVEAVAIVSQIIDDYTALCNIGMLDEIIIEFESNVSHLQKGDVIKFNGNLKIEVI